MNLCLKYRNDYLDEASKNHHKAMELDQPLKVPLVADVKIGKPGRTVNNEK